MQSTGLVEFAHAILQQWVTPYSRRIFLIQHYRVCQIKLRRFIVKFTVKCKRIYSIKQVAATEQSRQSVELQRSSTAGEICRYTAQIDGRKKFASWVVVRVLLTICWRQGVVRKTRWQFWRNLAGMLRHNLGGIIPIFRFAPRSSPYRLGGFGNRINPTCCLPMDAERFPRLRQ